MRAPQKTILIIDDEKGFAEALNDALDYEGYRVLTASTAEEALNILKNNKVDLATVDVMMPQGPSFESQVSSDRTGIALIKTINKMYPQIFMICISVITNRKLIKEIEGSNARFYKKGEVPLRTILDAITTKLFGRVFTS